jgi:serine/threonine protein phosphatase PrpC
MEVSFKTDKGVMRSNNEDSYFVIPGRKVYMVADGVGGSNSGETASRMTVTGIAGYIENNPLDGVDSFRKSRTYFTSCINRVNYDLVQKANADEELQGMATTIVLTYFIKNKMIVMNIGDSRAYLFRKGRLRQITEDHTYVNSLVKAGVITENEAETQNHQNYITRAVGADIKIKPDFFQVVVKPDDMILLCSDGLYGMVPEEEISEIMSSGEKMGEICTSLVNRANANGGADNITVVCLRVTEGDLNE